MTAQDRLLTLLTDRPTDTSGPWLDLVGDRPATRGRLQGLWESAVGALGYSTQLAVGDVVEPRLPDVLGTATLHTFYRVDRRLALHGGETVLDLACGPGTLTHRLSRAVGAAGLVVGADLSEPMLSRAARTVTEPNVALLRADASDLPLADDTVDAVCCSLCLHLVPDLSTAIAEIARVLRPGGRLAVAVPAHLDGARRRLSEGLARFAQARVFERGELAAALVAAGFSVIADRTAVLSLVDAVAPGRFPGLDRWGTAGV